MAEVWLQGVLCLEDGDSCSSRTVQAAIPGEGSLEFSNRSSVSRDFCDVIGFPLLLLKAKSERRCLPCWRATEGVFALLTRLPHPTGA